MRTTNDKKDYNLRIRLNDRMYSHLVRESQKNDESISGYIRDLIDRDIRANDSDTNNPDSGNDIAARG